MSAEGLYAQLRELADTEPDLSQSSPEVARWLGRLHQAVFESGGGPDIGMLKVASDGMGGALDGFNARSIRNILYRALAKVERQLPAAAQGGFVAAGDVYDALTLISSALENATERALIVDPYAGPEVLASYALMIPERMQVDLLGAEGRIKDSLKPAAEAWIQQYGEKRPFRIRCVDKSLLHDRLLIIDDKEAWDVSQSLNALAKRSPATIAKSRPDQAAMKVEAYAPLFDGATPLL